MDEQPISNHAVGWVNLLGSTVIMRVNVTDNTFDFLCWNEATFGNFSESKVYPGSTVAYTKCEELYRNHGMLS